MMAPRHAERAPFRCNIGSTTEDVNTTARRLILFYFALPCAPRRCAEPCHTPARVTAQFAVMKTRAAALRVIAAAALLILPALLPRYVSFAIYAAPPFSATISPPRR